MFLYKRAGIYSCSFNLHGVNLYILTLIFISIFTNNPQYIKGIDYEGYIFDKDHFVFTSVENQRERYTPIDDDIHAAEKILMLNIKQANVNIINQVNECPVIHNKLNKYARQYVGYVNSSGEKVIWINCNWSKSINKEQWKSDIIYVKDGCSYHWSILVNLDKNEIYELRVNGLG